jgi:hypothetical protein
MHMTLTVCFVHGQWQRLASSLIIPPNTLLNIIISPQPHAHVQIPRNSSRIISPITLLHNDIIALLNDAPMDPRAGLIWKKNLWGDLDLQWAIEPSLQVIEKVVRHALKIEEGMVCIVQLLAEGAFNKVYNVHCPDREDLIMRITLSVQPRFKTMSEYATIKYIDHHTTIPVPRVLASSSKRNRKLGYEWMIMKRIHGGGLQTQWSSMGWLRKELVVRNVISYFVQLLQKRFTLIGSLYATTDMQHLSTESLPNAVLLGSEFSTSDAAFCISQIVSIPFFWGKHFGFNVPRSPYKTSREWLTAQLQLYILDADEPESDTSGTDSDDEPDELTTPESIKRRANRLLSLVPQIFPESSEEFVLHHDDLNESNIMVDILNHNVTGIIDWECTHTVPLWYACQIPKFLGPDHERNTLPMPHEYTKDVQDDGSVVMNDLYFEHCEEYEKTQLRHFFWEEMARVCPEWVDVHRASKLKAAMGEVVRVLGDGTNADVIDDFLDRMERDEDAPSLREILREYDDRVLRGEVIDGESL